MIGLANHAWPDMRPIDWRYFLRRQTWEHVLLGDDVPRDVAEALRAASTTVHSSSPMPAGSGRTDVGHGEEGPAAFPAPAGVTMDLAVFGPEDVQTMAAAPPGAIGPTCRVVAILGESADPARRPRDIWARLRAPTYSGADDPRTWSHDPLAGAPGAQPFTVASALMPDDYRRIHYPLAPRSLRRYVWTVMSPPMGWKGRLARVGFASLGTSLLPILGEQAMTLWAEPSDFSPSAADTLVMTGEGGPAQPAILFITTCEVSPAPRGGSRSPVAVPTLQQFMKIPRTPARTDAAGLEREHRQLLRVADRLGYAPPATLRVEDHGDTKAWMQPAIRGVPMDRLPHAQQIDALYRLTEWWQTVEYAERRAMSEGRVTAPRISEWTRGLAASAKRNLDLTHEERSHLDDLPTLLAGHHLTMVFSHRDAHFRNVVVHDRQPRQVDWQNAGWGIPTKDLIFLVVHLAFHHSGRPYTLDSLDVIRQRVIDPATRFPWATEVLGRSKRHLRIDADTFGHLLATKWLRRCLRLALRPDSTPEERATLTELYLETWRCFRRAGGEPWRNMLGRPEGGRHMTAR